MNGTRQGWSLFECVLTITLVAVTVSMLIPAIRRAYESALDARCKSNLRQLAMACTEYARCNGHFPWGLKTEDGYSSYCWDFKKRSGSAFYEPGDLWQGYHAGDIVQCPKCRHVYDNWDGNGYTGYNYNCAYVGKVEGDYAARREPLRYDEAKDFERLALFGDGGYSGGPNKFMRAPKADERFDASAKSLRQAGTQAFRHLGHTNVAFADGHVEALFKSYKANGKEGWVSTKAMTGFICEDNALYGGGLEQ